MNFTVPALQLSTFGSKMVQKLKKNYLSISPQTLFACKHKGTFISIVSNGNTNPKKETLLSEALIMFRGIVSHQRAAAKCFQKQRYMRFPNNVSPKIPGN